MFKKLIFKLKKGQFYYCGQPYLLAAGLPEDIPAFPAELIFQHEPIKKKIILIRGMYPPQAPDFNSLIMLLPTPEPCHWPC